MTNVTLTVEFDGRELGAQLERMLAPAAFALGPAFVDAVEGGGSLWPVASGLSKASFGWRISQANRAIGIELTNTAVSPRGFPYPIVVEHGSRTRPGTHAAARTLQAAQRELVAAADAAVQRRLDANG